MNFFPKGARHTKWSHLWSVAAVIFALCAGAEQDTPQPHFNHTLNRNVADKKGRVQKLRLPRCYSLQLQEAISIGTHWDITQRPDPASFMPRLEQLAHQSGHTNEADEPLPDWATRLHQFQHNAEKMRAEGSKGKAAEVR